MDIDATVEETRPQIKTFNNNESHEDTSENRTKEKLHFDLVESQSLLSRSRNSFESQEWQ